MIGTIKALQDTWLKSKTKQATSLPEDSKIQVKRGETFDLLWIGDDIVQGHRAIDLETPLKGKHKWYSYLEHWEVSEVQHPRLSEFPLPEKREYTGRAVVLPIYGEMQLDEPMPGCVNFTVGELTHGGQRIPRYGDLFGSLTPEAVTQNLVKVAQYLETVRAYYGVPIRINSGYRPPSVNRAVGGSAYSRHMYGDAVDIVVQGINPREVYQRYDPIHNGGLGDSHLFTHFDLRPHRARWDYS